MAAEIAKQLKEFHQVDVPGSEKPQLCTDILEIFESGKLYIIDFEYAGYDCDYKLYPSKNEQYHFFWHYLSLENPNDAKPFAAKMSRIDFNYLDYFFLRYKEYKKRKILTAMHSNITIYATMSALLWLSLIYLVLRPHNHYS